METQILIVLIMTIIGVIGYFLKRTMDQLDKVKDNGDNNSIRISLVENNHTHLTDKFDMLYEAVRDLTNEIKNLNIKLSQKKDREI
jgi:hypothetical protein